MPEAFKAALKNFLFFIGAFYFGVVTGWVTSVAFHSHPTPTLKDVAAVMGAIGGAAVTKLFPNPGVQFSCYCVGMAIGFFGYLFARCNINFSSCALFSASGV